MAEQVRVSGGIVERFGDGWCARLGDGSSSSLVGFYRTREEAARALVSRCDVRDSELPYPRVPFTVLTGFLGAGKSSGGIGTTTRTGTVSSTSSRLWRSRRSCPDRSSASSSG
jgi:hypothetical protein